MALGIMLIVQASATLAAPDVGAFDLRAVPAKPCAAGGDEIVVCGRKDDDEAFRLRPLPPGDYEPKPLRAQIGLGEGKTLGVGTEQMGFPGGATSRRLMLTFKMKF